MEEEEICYVVSLLGRITSNRAIATHQDAIKITTFYNLS